jgi:hypothetical protein
MTMKPGDAIYVPSGDIAIAMSLGATFVEGDSRLRIPSPLPDGVSVSSFERWTTPAARVTWLSELLEMVSESDTGLLNLASLLTGMASNRKPESDVVRLYVPKSDMDMVRLVPGVRWSRELGMYVANSRADFSLIFPYLTESMKAIWAADRNVDAELSGLVKARALIAQREDDEPHDPPELERDPEGPKEKEED